MEQYDIFVYGFATLLIIVAIFMLFREAVCWYFKINERIDLQKRNNLLIEKLLISKGIDIYASIYPIKVKVKNRKTGDIVDIEIKSDNDIVDVLKKYDIL